MFAHLGYGLTRLNAADVKLQLSKMRLLHGIDKAAILAWVNIHMGKPVVLPGRHNITASYECSITMITTLGPVLIR